MEKDFCPKKDAYLTFFYEINNSITTKTIGCFQVNIKNAVKYIDHICCCCSQFVDPLKLESIYDNNAILMAIFETDILHYCNFNICDCYSEFFIFCYNCWTYISGGKKPKFNISNKMAQFCCQYYPTLLEDLTSAEEAVIARIYPVVTILKLKPNNSFNPGTYKGVYGYSVILPQNPGSLLTILPSEIIFIDDVV